MPAQSGTATLAVSVMNKNDKKPYFLPSTVRTQITENTPVGSRIVRLNATDADVASGEALTYAIVEPITAVNKDGKRVEDEDSRFKTFFKIDGRTGQVSIAEPLDRSSAATVTLTVQVVKYSSELRTSNE